MAVDLQTLPAPVSLPDAKPSDLIESLPEDRWTGGIMRHVDKHGIFHYCAVGILLEHGGYDWDDVDEVGFLTRIYGIGMDTARILMRINDTQGKAAVVAYLRERGL